MSSEKALRRLVNGCALSKVSRGLRTGRGWEQGWERKEVTFRLKDVRTVKGTCDTEGDRGYSPVDFAQWLSSATPDGLKMMLPNRVIGLNLPGAGRVGKLGR